ncbi:hypothetical protein V2J09_021889 [Rumex salicifolius]
MALMEEDDESHLTRLQEAVQSHPDDPSHQFNLGLFLWNREGLDWRAKAAEHFMLAAKLNPQNGEAFRYLGDYYRELDVPRALKCYQRAVSLIPEDSHSGELLCDLLDKEGKESLELAVCHDASSKSSRAFWALRRLGYLLVHQKKWFEAVPNLQHAIRGYPTCADLWEALGLAYQRLGMYTAAIKSYGRALDLEDSKAFAMIESGNIFLELGSFRKGIENFRQALEIFPQNISAQYGLASALLALSKECANTGGFTWAASLLKEAAEIANFSSNLAGNMASIWKLHGDIQLSYAKCLPWNVEGGIPHNEEAFSASISSWRNKCLSAAVLAKRSYQRALHLAPWQANFYSDVAISVDLRCSLNENFRMNLTYRQLPEKMALGSLLLECDNHEFWIALGCLSDHKALKQHALIRGLHLDVTLAIAWAYLGKLYGEEGDKQLARQAFDRARSIDPSLALPWAGMSTDIHLRDPLSDEAYESCLRAVQIMPVAEFQIGLTQLALPFGRISSPLVFGAIRQAVQLAPYYPESHNLNGLVSEAKFDYESATASFRLARFAMKTYDSTLTSSNLTDITINLARVLSKTGNALEAVQELDSVKKAGSLDMKGLQIYVISLWKLGKGDLALIAAKELAMHTVSMEPSSAAASIVLICNVMYSVSGIESTTNSILKMPKSLFQSSKVSFVVSAIQALDQSNRLEPVVSISRNALILYEEIAEMHLLVALSKMIKQGSKSHIEWQSGIRHLRKVLHIYPNNAMLRNSLGYILLCSNSWETYHVANRCYALILSDHPNKVGLKSPYEILGAEAVGCHVSEDSNLIYSSTCRYSSMRTASKLQQLQRWMHLEPWNDNARYLLILALLQKASETNYRQHLLNALKRMISAALGSQFCLLKTVPSLYQKFQLLLCASEISLRGGDLRSCISFAKDASELPLPGSCIFFAHLQLCRAHAVENNYANLEEDYYRCLKLQTCYPIGWICLKFIISVSSLDNDPNVLDGWISECLENDPGRDMWMAVYNLVCGLTSFWTGDYQHAEESIAKACSLADTESCLFLCHGAICMELARKLCDIQYLSSAVKSLRRALECSTTVLPFVPLLLAQAEGSLGSKPKWERNLRFEWFSWPLETKPAEIYFQMHLLAKDSRYGSDVSSHPECQHSPEKWILKAIHLNPSCMRYWNTLWNLLGYKAHIAHNIKQDLLLHPGFAQNLLLAAVRLYIVVVGERLYTNLHVTLVGLLATEPPL